MKMKKKILIILLILIILFLITGYIYEKLSKIKDAKDYKPVGTLYTIENNNMHIYEGGKGDATVVFASGWGTTNPYVDFYPLYDRISNYAKFVVYDRFGYGYSDITGKSRDIDTIVKEIHELLNVSSNKPPYIFVAHSLASLEVIRYAQIYKDEVKGIVLIDGGNPEYYAKTKPITFISEFQKKLIDFGIARILYNSSSFVNSLNSERNELKLLPDALKSLDKKSTLLKAYNKDVINEMKMSQKNAQKVVDSGKLDNIPLTIITSGDFGQASKDWLDSQVEFKNWSNISKKFVVQDTMHYIHQYHPEIIASEIINMINNK